MTDRKAGNLRKLNGEFDFRGELSAVMYGFGDQLEQLPESLNLMNDIVVEYMEGLTREAMAATFNGQLSEEGLQFAIRKDQRKVDRVKQLLVMYDKVVEERNLKLQDDEKTATEAAPPKVEAQTPAPTKKRKAGAAADGTKTKRAKAANTKAAPKAKVQGNKVSEGVKNLDAAALASLRNTTAAAAAASSASSSFPIAPAPPPPPFK